MSFQFFIGEDKLSHGVTPCKVCSYVECCCTDSDIRNEVAGEVTGLLFSSDNTHIMCSSTNSILSRVNPTSAEHAKEMIKLIDSMTITDEQEEKAKMDAKIKTMPWIDVSQFRTTQGIESNLDPFLRVSEPSEYNYYTELMKREASSYDKIVCKIPFPKPTERQAKIDAIMAYMPPERRACDACTSSGTPCTHKMVKQAFWKPAERQEKTDAITASTPPGLSKPPTAVLDFVLKREWIESLQTRELYEFKKGVNGIDVAIVCDVKEITICTTATAVLDSRVVIIGLDSISTFKAAAFFDMLDKHILGIRALSQFKETAIWFHIESNMNPMMVDLIKTRVESNSEFGLVNVNRFAANGSIRYGVYTSFQKKKEYIEKLIHFMSLGSLSYAKEFVCVGGETDKIKRVLEEQIGDVRTQKQYKEGPVEYIGVGPGMPSALLDALEISLYY